MMTWGEGSGTWAGLLGPAPLGEGQLWTWGPGGGGARGRPESRWGRRGPGGPVADGEGPCWGWGAGPRGLPRATLTSLPLGGGG